MTQSVFWDYLKYSIIRVPYSNDEISKSVTKHNKFIPTCSTASSTKEETHKTDQFVPIIKIMTKKKSSNNRNMFKMPSI